jgi:hypothetical protein
VHGWLLHRCGSAAAAAAAAGGEWIFEWVAWTDGLVAAGKPATAGEVQVRPFGGSLGVSGGHAWECSAARTTQAFL